MSSATWTGRADNRSVTTELTARLAALSAQENFEHLRRMAQQLKDAPAAAKNLMQQGLNILGGLSGAVLDRTATVAVQNKKPLADTTLAVVADATSVRPESTPRGRIIAPTRTV